jgi:hypothetical protein
MAGFIARIDGKDFKTVDDDGPGPLAALMLQEMTYRRAQLGTIHLESDILDRTEPVAVIALFYPR